MARVGRYVTWDRALAWRLRRQLLDPIGSVSAPAVVRALCGVQAQVPSAAELAVAVRQAPPLPVIALLAATVSEVLGQPMGVCLSRN